MPQFAVLKAFDLAAAPFDIGDCFGLGGEPDDTPSFTSMIRVGFTTQAVADRRNGWSREINIAEYQLYRWLLDRGAYDGETVLVCWPGVDCLTRSPKPGPGPGLSRRSLPASP